MTTSSSYTSTNTRCCLTKTSPSSSLRHDSAAGYSSPSTSYKRTARTGSQFPTTSPTRTPTISSSPPDFWQANKSGRLNTRLGLTIRNDCLDEFLATDAALIEGALVAEFTDYTLLLGPHRFSLGQFNVVAPRMCLTNLDELRAAVGTTTEPTARYECIDGEGGYYKLGPLVHEPENP